LAENRSPELATAGPKTIHIPSHLRFRSLLSLFPEHWTAECLLLLFQFWIYSWCFQALQFVFVSQHRYYFGSGHPHLLPHSLSFMMGALEYYISSHLCYGDGKVHHESAERVLGIRLYHFFFFYTACFCERRDETERHKERELLFVCHVYSISILHIVEHELMQGKISLDTLLDVLTMHDLCNFECRL
jgi:hypothetical protein